MNNYCVYMHENKINQKKYIGITKQKPQDRWGSNGINYKNRCPHFWNAIQKYGWDNFVHTIVASDLTKEEAVQMEIDLIEQYKTQNTQYGYNILSGGTAPQLPIDVRKKMSMAMIGNKNGLGKPCSKQKAKKISDAQKGRKFSQERKQKLRKPKSVSYPCSQQKRQHIIDAKKDKKQIRCIDSGQIFESIHECARRMGLQATTICAVLRGRLKSTGGHTFEYYDAIKA